MKNFWKTFILSIIFFTIAIYLGSHSYTKINKKENYANIGTAEKKDEEEIVKEKTVKERMIKKEENYDSLEDAFKNSKRINALVVGLEDVRTDTIMFASFQPEDKKVDIISIPSAILSVTSG